MSTVVSTAEMLDKYAEKVSPGSRSQHVDCVRRFLNFSKGDTDGAALRKYTENLLDRYGPNSVRRVHLTAIRRFYKINGLEWPLDSRELPKVREIDIYKPALAEEDIIDLILAVKAKPSWPPEYAALLALSSIYGMRRIELSETTPQTINLKDRLLYVETAKHGRERTHVLPDAIMPYLKAALPYLPINPSQVSKSFPRLWDRAMPAGRTRPAEVGYHSIRRSLVRLLVMNGAPTPAVRNYLRWKRGGSDGDDMLGLYFSTNVVSSRGTSEQQQNNPDKQTDEIVFKAHPFLKYWE